MAKSKLIIHCGSSKNGSTAIQNMLLKTISELAQHNIGVVVLSYPAHRQFDQVKLDECKITIGRNPSSDIVKTQIRGTNLGPIYEIYKRYRKQNDVNGLRNLKQLICDHIADGCKAFNTLVLSAEAFEGSLCLRDGLFRWIIKSLGKTYDVSLVYYKPDEAIHALRSWTQWGWMERVRYSDWVRLYVVKTDRRAFFDGFQRSYWGNLIDIKCWIGYWKGVRGVKMKVHHEQDTCKHFFEKVLRIRLTPDISDLTPQARNVGWPKSFITLYPLYFGFFDNYDKFEVLRQLIVDKAAAKQAMEKREYRELLALTQIAMQLREKKANKTKRIAAGNLEVVLRCMDQIFERTNPTVVAEACRIMAESIYYYHQKLRLANGT